MSRPMIDYLRRLKRTAMGLARLSDLPRLERQSEYLQREVERLRAANRRLAWREAARDPRHAEQTKASFDFQWDRMPTGAALPSDPSFMARVADDLTRMVDRPGEWFRDKLVVDVGCGIGRYSHGFLQLGARVLACDQSEAALRRTAELCAPFADRLTLKRIDLLEWRDSLDADLAFSFGVVHHTGNTYLAIENVCRKVRPGGRLFLMVYSVPRDYLAYFDVDMYERIADENHDLSFEERRDDMVRRFGGEKAHGWFDATSPSINDRLTFQEIRDLLAELGFAGIRETIVGRDHHVIADRPAR